MHLNVRHGERGLGQAGAKVPFCCCWRRKGNKELTGGTGPVKCGMLARGLPVPGQQVAVSHVLSDFDSVGHVG